MYQLFKRSARNFEEFATAEKIPYCETETEKEAQEECRDFNNNLTDEEIEKGTKLEYTKKD